MGSINAGNNFIGFAPGYSGGNISGSMTFANTDFLTLGIDNSQSYLWTLDANGDTVGLEFVPPTPVPEGSNIVALILFGGVLVMGLKSS